MKPVHTNPDKNNPRIDSKTGDVIFSRAPYNFIPLPEKVVTVDTPPVQDVYEGLTGWLDCELVTKSPTYIRGLVSEEVYKRQAAKEPSEELSVEEKEERAEFFSLENVPLIPGSSLRGMIRNILEIISFSKMRWVGAEPTFTFRAVAAQRDDPLRDPYQKIMGKFGSAVKTGYLKQRGEEWYIQPAKTPAKIGFTGVNIPYLKINDTQIPGNIFTGYERIDSSNYKPGYYQTEFSAEEKKGKQGAYLHITQIGKPHSGLAFQGTLVCSGNMKETGGRTRRKKHSLVLEADTSLPVFQIPPESTQAYLSGLTSYQKELKAWGGKDWGCLRNNAPVFYVQTATGEVYFGHCPNFRIPARLQGESRSATPVDFVPNDLKDDHLIDFADAIFGWAPEPGSQRKTSSAGRVFVGDAHYQSADEKIWYQEKKSLTPRTLSGPKPTTFQHYLVQDKDKRHDPDRKSALAHYGTSSQETQIRGYKAYWHKGRNPQLEASDEEKKHESQLTRIKPVAAGVHFYMRIHFDNLRQEELGALLWALQPAGRPDVEYCHKIGMGKPLGMGAIQFHQVKINLTKRSDERYTNLFKAADGGKKWQEGEYTPNVNYAEIFETFVLDQLAVNQLVPEHAKKLLHLERIQDLLEMLTWRGDAPSDDWLDWTRYMELNHGKNKLDEFKERPVLPGPREVANWAAPKKAEEPKEAKGNLPQIPQIGQDVWGKVHDIETDGTIWVNLENLPEDSEIMGRILPKNLFGKQYKEGYRIHLGVISVDDEIFDCVPVKYLKNELSKVDDTPKSEYLKGEVIWFGEDNFDEEFSLEVDYGEILGRDGETYFVQSHQLKLGQKKISKGAHVVFRKVKGMKGYEAQDVHLEDEF